MFCTNYILTTRQVIEEQAKVSAIISKDMFDSLEGTKELYDLWMKLFETLGATYVYPVLFEYILSDDDIKINIFRNYEDIDRTLSYKMREKTEIKPVEKTMYRVITDMRSFIADSEMRELIGDGEIKTLNDLIKKDSSRYFEYLESIRYLNNKGIIDIV